MIWVETFKEVAIGCSALSAAAVAWKGLYTWRDQLQGEHHHKVARDALIAIFDYRNFVLNTRERYLDALDSPSKNKLSHALSGQTYAQKIFEDFSEDYRMLSEKCAELEQIALEVELLWDKTTADQIQLMIDMGRDMGASLMLVEAFVDKDAVNGYSPKEIVASLGGLPEKTRARLLSYSINRQKTEKHEDLFPATFNAVCGHLKKKLGRHLVRRESGWRAAFKSRLNSKV